MKVVTLIEEYKDLIKTLDDISSTLSKIRGAEWERGIQLDKRLSVTTLFKLYTETRAKLEDLLDTDVIEYIE